MQTPRNLRTSAALSPSPLTTTITPLPKLQATVIFSSAKPQNKQRPSSPPRNLRTHGCAPQRPKGQFVFSQVHIATPKNTTRHATMLVRHHSVSLGFIFYRVPRARTLSRTSTRASSSLPIASTSWCTGVIWTYSRARECATEGLYAILPCTGVHTNDPGARIA